ncbi:MAG: Gfo/Idh/MocA family oxidoreductase [Phycisphaerae bacterium]
MSKRICVIGAGRWGTNHIKTLAGLGHLAGIVECNAARLDALKSQYPGVRVLNDVREALDLDFDGFTVATPAETHASIAGLLLSRGKHVLVEKPIALTAAEARRLRDLAASNGVNLMVGHVMLFHPAIRKMKEMIDGGKIGKLQYLYSNRLNLGTVRTEENILWSFAPHDISIFQYFIGALPSEIVSRGGAFVQPGIHDSTMTVLTYPGNVVGHIFVSWLHPFKEHRLVVIGSKGMLSFEDSSELKEVLFYEKGIDWIKGEPIKRDGPTEAIACDRAMPLTEELRYFADHLDGRPIEGVNGDDAATVLDVLERATESLRSGTGARQPTAPQPLNRCEAPGVFVHPTSCVDDGAVIGEGTKVWHYSHVQGGARIGAHCSLGQNVNVGEGVTIGDHVKIQNNVSVYNGVTLEDYVFCGPSMVFTNIPDPRSKYPQRGSKFNRKTRVREGASIGANATILCGHTIGRHAMIGAGAVVTKDVPDYALMVGVPARRTGWACECGEVLGEVEKQATCPRCGLKYERKKDGLAAGER